MKLISHRYIYARTIEDKKNYKRGLKFTVNSNYLNKYLKKKERKEKEQERGTKVSTVSKTLYTSIHGQKMEKKRKKKFAVPNRLFHISRFDWGQVTVCSRSAMI